VDKIIIENFEYYLLPEDVITLLSYAQKDIYRVLTLVSNLPSELHGKLEQAYMILEDVQAFYSR